MSEARKILVLGASGLIAGIVASLGYMMGVALLTPDNR